MANNPPLPAFLQQSKAEISNKFIDITWQQRHRARQGRSSTTQTSPWSRLSGDEISARNRYSDIEPYASNRIKLLHTHPTNKSASDYINASPIVLGGTHPNSSTSPTTTTSPTSATTPTTPTTLLSTLLPPLPPRHYIATQGPTPYTTPHFYRMCASELSSPNAVIVMLTQTHEGGGQKCFPYFPVSARESPIVIPADDEKFADGFAGQVELVDGVVQEDARARCQVRRLRLRAVRGGWPRRDKGGDGVGEKELEIRHLLFAAWPDFSVPEKEDRAALVELVGLSARLNRRVDGNGGMNGMGGKEEMGDGLAADLAGVDAATPRIVHCSAGVGRSGTFIALDYLLYLLWHGYLDRLPADCDPVAETVDVLRQQRMTMVQSEAQFMLLYEILREQWHVRPKEMGSSGRRHG